MTRSVSSGLPRHRLYGDRMRRNNEDRSGHGKRNLHRSGYGNRRHRLFAVPDQRECSHHHPVRGTCVFGKRDQENEMLTAVGSFLRRTSRALCILGIFSASLAWASVGGSIAGTVKDPSGRVVPGAGITIREVNTGLSYQTHTDNKGYYALPVLPVGRYELEVEAAGFRGYQRRDIVLDTNAALTLDASLQVGGNSETVSVNDNTLHVETTSSTAGAGDQRQADGVCSAGRAQLHRSSLSAAWRRSADVDYRYNGAGRGSNDSRSFGHTQSGHDLCQWAARVRQLFQRERQRCGRGRQRRHGDHSQSRCD